MDPFLSLTVVGLSPVPIGRTKHSCQLRFPGPVFGRGQRTQAPKRRKRVTTEGHLPLFSRESFVPNSMALGPSSPLFTELLFQPEPHLSDSGSKAYVV